MKLFYATGNQSKIYNMRRRLAGKNISIVTPAEVSIKIDVEEDGKTPIENALKKARSYYAKVQMPIIAGDSGLYIDNIPAADQPGLFVRRVNGKTLSDDEMIIYYSVLSQKYGGKLRAHYLTGLAMIVQGQEYTIEIPDDDFLLTAQTNKNRLHRGNPLDVISIDPSYMKYVNDLTDEEAKKSAEKFDKECVRFLEQAHILI